MGRWRYVLCPAEPDQISAVEVEKHWAAVLPRDCQPEDCGQIIPALAWVRQINGAGTTFAMALVEGTKAKLERQENLLRLTTNEAQYLISCGPTEQQQIVTDADCACVRYEGGRPVGAWVFGGTSLRINGMSWFSVPNPRDASVQPPD